MPQIASTTFLLLASALVMLMIPSVGLFYGGMVRSINVLNTLIQSFVILSMVTVLWVLVGYSLVFCGDWHGWIGTLGWAGLQNLPISAPTSENIDCFAHVIFQGMFASITPTLINGSVVERVRFVALILFTFVWSILVYCPIAHWVWAEGGFLNQMGAIDFAGGTVVHISSGFAGLAACLYVGKRKTHHLSQLPHNLTLSLMGGMLLWFGWFGFNGGSSLAQEKMSSIAFLMTNLSAASGSLSWMVCEVIYQKRLSALGIVSGAITGLVAITPCAGYVSVFSTIFIGIIAGVISYFFVIAKTRIFRYDDTLDVFGIHGMGGVVGAILAGVFSSSALDAEIPNGLIYGNPKQVLIQLLAVIISASYAFVMTFIILSVINRITKVRASEKDEKIGLDLTQHGEEGYRL